MLITDFFLSAVIMSPGPHSDRHVRIYFGGYYAPFFRDSCAQAISCLGYPIANKSPKEMKSSHRVSRFVKYSS